jgi:hypothetical protein
VDSVIQLAIDTGGFVFGTRGQKFDLGGGYSSADVTYDYNELVKEKIKLYTRELNIQVNGFYTLKLAEPSSRKESKIVLQVVDKPGGVKKDVAFTYCRVLPAAK